MPMKEHSQKWAVDCFHWPSTGLESMEIKGLASLTGSQLVGRQMCLQTITIIVTAWQRLPHRDREQLQPGKYTGRSESVILPKQEIRVMLLEDKIDADVFPIPPATYNWKPGHYTYNKREETLKGGEKAVNVCRLHDPKKDMPWVPWVFFLPPTS